MNIRKRLPGERIQTSWNILQLHSSRIYLYEQLRRETDLVVDPDLFPIMSAIEWLGPLRLTALAREVGLDRSTLSRYTARLERAHLVERSPDPYDHRSTVVQLTQTGRVELSRLHQEIAHQIDRLLAAWPDGESERFANQFEQFIDAIRGAWPLSSSAGDHSEET
jgi:DNA-binding MarR family transcriptional regulator